MTSFFTGKSQSQKRFQSRTNTRIRKCLGHQCQAHKARIYAVCKLFFLSENSLGPYLGLIVSSRAAVSLDTNDPCTVAVTFITIIICSDRVWLGRGCRLRGFVKVECICHSVTSFDLVLSEHMAVKIQSSQCYKRTHILLLLKTAHSRGFIICVDLQPHFVRQRLVQQLVVNVNISRSVSRIFVNGDVLYHFKSHLPSQLGNVCIFL